MTVSGQSRGRGPLQALALGLALAALPLPAWSAPLETLASRLEATLSAPRFGAAEWGVKVVSLDTGRTLFEHDAGKYLLPASVTKLFTGALVLHQPGPGFRIRTSLYAEKALSPSGVLHGDLILYGRGDPTILDKDTHGPDPLEALAAQAWEAGLRSVDGDILGDDTFFWTPPFGSGWEYGDLAFPFAARPSALTIHDNETDLRVYPALSPGRPCAVFPMPGLGCIALTNLTTTAPGEGIRASRAWGDPAITLTGALPPGAAAVQLAVPLHDPALLFAQLTQRALARRGITVLGTARAVHPLERRPPLDTAPLLELGHLESPPLGMILRETLKRSNDLDAQLLFLQAGAAAQGPGLNTEARSVEAMKAFLRTAGVPSGEVLLEEGSGLSRKDLVTPEAIVDLLAYLSRTPCASLFREALPLAGVDGTLEARMRQTPAAGRVWAKTGTMTYTYALAGYVTTASGEHLAFAMLLNNYHREPQDPTPQAELDALTVALAEN